MRSSGSSDRPISACGTIHRVITPASEDKQGPAQPEELLPPHEVRSVQPHPRHHPSRITATMARIVSTA